MSNARVYPRDNEIIDEAKKILDYRYKSWTDCRDYFEELMIKKYNINMKLDIYMSIRNMRHSEGFIHEGRGFISDKYYETSHYDYKVHEINSVKVDEEDYVSAKKYKQRCPVRFRYDTRMDKYEKYYKPDAFEQAEIRVNQRRKDEREKKDREKKELKEKEEENKQKIIKQIEREAKEAKKQLTEFYEIIKLNDDEVILTISHNFFGVRIRINGRRVSEWIKDRIRVTLPWKTRTGHFIRFVSLIRFVFRIKREIKMEMSKSRFSELLEINILTLKSLKVSAKST
jgi:hypothetical protein